MNPILRNILAVIAAVPVGMAVNMGIVMLSHHVIPPPEGADVSTYEGLAASMHLFGPEHFLMPFLAHALGTLAGASVAALIAVSHRMWFAMGIGVFFLLGGIGAVYMLPTAPLWFNVLDLTLAYLPMGYLGGRLAARLTAPRR